MKPSCTATMTTKTFIRKLFFFPWYKHFQIFESKSKYFSAEKTTGHRRNEGDTILPSRTASDIINIYLVQTVKADFGVS